MEGHDWRLDAESLARSSKVAIVGTVDDHGFPDIRAMTKLRNDGMKEAWFATHLSNAKVTQIKENPRMCIYFVDTGKWVGLTLIGEGNVLQDTETKERFWSKTLARFYPGGASDPEYCILHFKASRGKYFHGGSPIHFDL